MRLDMIVVLVTALAIIGVITLLWVRTVVIARSRYADYEASIKNLGAQIADMAVAARAVCGYLPETSLDVFYNESNGVQRNFTQRQGIMARVQEQNNALRTFTKVFEISPTTLLQAQRKVNPEGRTPAWHEAEAKPLDGLVDYMPK